MFLNIQMYGGRGASSGISVKGLKHGTEYTTLLVYENIKFIEYNLSSSAKFPLETMSDNRIYVLVNSEMVLKGIVFFDENHKKCKEIDISGIPHMIDGKPYLPHVHEGYIHDENGTRDLNDEEKKMVDNIIDIWNNYIGKK